MIKAFYIVVFFLIVMPALPVCAADGNELDDDDAFVCKGVMEAFNKNERFSFFSQNVTKLTSPPEGYNSPYGDHLRGLLIDLNRDGKQEFVTLNAYGTARISVLSVWDMEERKHIDVDLPRDGYDPSLRTYKDKVYLLSGTYRPGRHYHPSGIWTYNKEWKPTPLCRFKYSEEPFHTLIYAEDRDLCDKAKTGKLSYVAYDTPYFFDESNVRAYSPAMREEAEGKHQDRPIMGARVDANNDGEEDTIIRVSYTSGAGRGCSFQYIAAIKPLDEKIPFSAVREHLDAKVDPLIWKIVNPGVGCVGVEAFSLVNHEGKIYVEEKFDKHAIRLNIIENDQIREVCKFEVRQQIENWIQVEK